MDSLCTTDQGFGPKNALSNLMDQIDTPSQVNGLSMHFTLNYLISSLVIIVTLSGYNNSLNRIQFPVRKYVKTLIQTTPL